MSRATALGTTLAGVLVLILAAPVEAKPTPGRIKARTASLKAAAVRRPSVAPARPTGPSRDGAHAQISIGQPGTTAELRPARLTAGKPGTSPLSLEDETAAKITKLLRGPLRNGDTGLYVVDARTGAPLFSVNADERMNPASNVKMISTATALELLGPEFRYPTRLLGPTPEGGVIHGDVFLLGSYDPTLTTADLGELAQQLAARGVTSIEGSLVVGTDPTRDGIYRAVIPIEITAGEPGHPAIAVVPPTAEHVTVTVAATTSKRPLPRPRLTYKVETVPPAAGSGPGATARIHVTIGGVIGKGGTTTFPLATKERTATAAYALRGALGTSGIHITGGLELAELGDFIGDAVGAGVLPVELGRHDSLPLGEIVAKINKWSINWLADRVVMTAAALARRQPPTMELAVDAMYGWLERHPHLGKQDLVVDTGSGLSYRTQISPTELVAIVRAASGFGEATDPALARAWTGSLSIAGTDGTLRHRVRGADVRARIRGKTGTLSTAIAMSGLLDVDPDHPLAFSLVTNTRRPLSKASVRRAHDLVIGALCSYAARTSRAPERPALAPVPAAATPPAAASAPLEDLEDIERDPGLDAETSAQP